MYLIHYSEIGLKGKNKHLFEKQLKANIERAGGTVTTLHGRMLFDGPPDLLPKTYGIAWYAPCSIIDPQYESIKQAVLALAKTHQPKTFRITTRRADKSFPFTSQELNIKLGEAVCALGSTVNLSTPGLTFYVEIIAGKAFLHTEKHLGLAGLPVGSSGKVLVLLSGGVDSAVAAAKMLSRGCSLAYVHFHVLRDDISTTKIPRIVRALTSYGGPSKLHLIDANDIQLAIANTKKHELVLFRHFMITSAIQLAHKLNCQAIVLGDSIGQVASQTLENIRAAEQGTDLPILRPLCGTDKETITAEAKQLDVFTTCNEPYKDCCSLLATSPATKEKPERITKAAADLNLLDFTRQALDSLEIVEVK